MWKMYKQSLESSGGNAAAGILEAEADNSLSTEECLRTGAEATFNGLAIISGAEETFN